MMLDSIYQKLKILGPSAKYDTCGPKELTDQKIPGIYFAKTKNGYCRLFKILQTNVCIKHCRYCINQICLNTPRAYLAPEETAKAFIELIEKRLVEGLFLSSGIMSKAETAMTRVLETVLLLRKKYRYKGYIHLKVMPGVSNSCLTQAVRLSDRVSLNLEAPNKLRLNEISPDKDYDTEVLNTVIRLNSIRQRYNLENKKHVSQTTQFVVGVSCDNDAEIIETTEMLYKKFNLSRVFYSAFTPVTGSSLANKSPCESVRQYRLYQVDWLLRFYGFQKNDIPLGKNGKLSLQKDPKLLWAEDHPEYFPVEINKTPYSMLLKVPGIGPEGAKQIISLRQKHGKFYDHYELRKIRIVLNRASPFILVNGKYEHQLQLFS